MKVFFLKSFIALIVTLTIIPLITVYADSGLFNVLDYDVGYDIENGELLTIDLDIDFATLSVEIVSLDDGFIELIIPRGMIDSVYSETEDDIFYVIIDGTESHYLEITSTDTSRTLIIPFFAGDEQIEIFGTDVLLSEPSVVESTGKLSDDKAMMDDKEIPAFQVDVDTVSDDKAMMDDKEIVREKEGGGCLIATAAYGSELAPQIQFLREVRDNTVMSTTSGTAFMSGFNQLYYSFSPTIADWERQNPIFKETVRAFITPMISTLSILTLAEDGSESHVLDLGISIIALNLGMYVAVPTITIWQIKKRIRMINYVSKN